MRNRTQILRKTCPFPGKRPGSGARDRRCLSLPVVSVVKEPLPQAGGPWGHSIYVLSVTYKKRKFKMVLSKCCQKSFAAQCFGKRRARERGTKVPAGAEAQSL